MGLADRDYMRERPRNRQGIGPNGKKWNDGKGRVELDDSVPLGSASWIADTEGWFTGKSRGPGFRKGRWRPGRRARSGAAREWIIALSALTFLIPAYREAKRNGWFPDLQPAVAFPRSGSVTANRAVDPRKATARLRVVTDQANAVVQLYNRDTDEHVISVYVRRDDDVSVPVPPGTYRMQLVEGDKWHGTVRYFGPSTTYETVIQGMTFSKRQGNGVDLHRSPAGKLPTHANLTIPKALQ